MPRIVNPADIKKGSGLANQDSVDANAFMDEVVEGQSQGLGAHVLDPKGAHPASAISTTTSGGAYDGTNVQANLDELSGLIPPRPPTLGNYSNILSFSGIPDWGHLKLHDAGFVQRGEVASPVPTSPNSDFFVYPEFWFAPAIAGNTYLTNARGTPFPIAGNDPADPIFNLDPALTPDPTYTGGGVGQAHQGGFTVAGTVLETMRVLPSSGGAFRPIVVSGTVYPADRGVLALIYWPPQGDVTAFLAEPLTDRCPAALLLGQGFNDSCDGDVGGIFSEGGPEIFPGRSAGQLDLSEIHLGINRITGAPLPAGPLPGAGQVRLGTDPAAGPVVPGGIPILGGTTASTGGGNDNNFFRYRLPYLEDYSNLGYTPDTEVLRYFEKPPVSENFATNLTQAGEYEPFPKDYWNFQVARYRHRFNFLQNFPLPPLARAQGNYILMHFKREADFEAFVRDGVMPDDLSAGYSLWGTGLVSYVPEESTDNLVDATTFAPNPATSLAYHTGRYGIVEDDHTVVSDLFLAYTFLTELDQTMFVSGVQYLLPNGSAPGSNFRIDSLDVSFADLFRNTYRLGNAGSFPVLTPGLEHTVPVVLYLGGHTAQMGTLLNGAGPGYTGIGFYQRVDFIYADLGFVSGPFDLLNPPAPGDTADILLTGADTPIRFGGDGSGGDTPNQVHFWQDARIRAFARVPSDQENAASYSTDFLIPTPGGVSILFHTTDHAPLFTGTSPYGNFTLGGPGNPPRPGLETGRKDVEERFLDEVYRVAESALVPLDPTFNPGLSRGNLTGPGLPFPAVPIELPVRFASESPFSFGFASFLQLNYHLLDLSLPPIQPVQNEAQVAGLPDRNPPVVSGAANPCPFSGRLVYPSTNYTAGFRPSLADGDITVPQPDYSTIVDPERVYLRVFDALYGDSGTPEVDVVGQPFLTFRIDGLELADFAYTPGPGPGNSNIAIEVKIPGYTTWMDLGRFDGAGPSKQDTVVDGAGCQINDATVCFNGRDAVTGTVYAQVKINVGPSADVFANTGVTSAPVGVAPVLVRVRVKQGSVLDFTQGGPDSSVNTPRALCGITLLRHSDGTGPNDTAPFGPPVFP